MKGWKDVLVGPKTSVQETIQIIDASALQIALVVNEDGHLLGTVTDGDVRRGILRNIPLDAPVETVMNVNPTTVRPTQDRDEIIAVMRRLRLHHIPVVDAEKRVIGLEILDELLGSSRRENIVVIMAGGLGSRLKPLTDDTPKPMLPIGGRPILEIILRNFLECGFYKFYFCVNYKADTIQSYFGDGSRWDAEIQYIRESQKLGTAGPLSLLPALPERPLVVMNGDLLTKVNFGHLLDFHALHRASATMCVREYQLQVPYGVLTLDNHRILTIEEKPVQRFFVNAGIYILDPSSLELVPKHCYFDMPTLFEKLIQSRKQTAAFPVREYWLDIGQHADFEQANGDLSSMSSP